MTTTRFAALVGLAALVAEPVACTNAQGIQATTAVFAAADVACVALALSGAIIPAGTTAATVAADVELFCPFVKDVEPIILSLEGQQADAGVSPQPPATYVPSPIVQAKRAKR